MFLHGKIFKPQFSIELGYLPADRDTILPTEMLIFDDDMLIHMDALRPAKTVPVSHTLGFS